MTKLPATGDVPLQADDSQTTITEVGQSRVERDWDQIRAALTDRIRRHLLALQRLSPDTFPAESVEQELGAASDDAQALWRLAERLDRALDLAFAPRARRVSMPDPMPRAAAKSNPDEFKAR